VQRGRIGGGGDGIRGKGLLFPLNLKARPYNPLRATDSYEKRVICAQRSEARELTVECVRFSPSGTR